MPASSPERVTKLVKVSMIEGLCLALMILGLVFANPSADSSFFGPLIGQGEVEHAWWIWLARAGAIGFVLCLFAMTTAVIQGSAKSSTTDQEQ